jgi:hypothetical protein
VVSASAWDIISPFTGRGFQNNVAQILSPNEGDGVKGVVFDGRLFLAIVAEV